MLNPAPNPAQSGFSLAELMIGIAILGILASVAAPNFRIWMQNSQIRNAAESIVNGLQLARTTAVTRNSNTQFVLCAPPDSSWDVLVASPTAINQPCAADDAGAPGWERVQRRSSEGSRNATITTVNPGTRIATFDGFGVALANNPFDGSPRFTQLDVDSSAISPQESADLRILLNAGGSTRMCDPNAPVASSRAC